MNVDVFKDFLTRLNREIKGKIFLIVDNLKVHHARYLTEWLESRSRMLELFYLPSYSPELNPDEYLNRDLKARLAEQNLPTSKDALRQSVEMHMRKRHGRKMILTYAGEEFVKSAREITMKCFELEDRAPFHFPYDSEKRF